MTYRVVWTSDAQSDLATIWMESPDRRAVAAAADRLDMELPKEPAVFGESRSGQVRIAFSLPLAIEFEVHDPDLTVYVLAVWAIHRPRD